MNASPRHACLVCASEDVCAVQGFERLARITSDCKPFPPGGELFQCAGCGAVQKARSDRWLAEIERIYAGYAPYYQAGGSEQLSVEMNANGSLRPRSEILVRRLGARFALPACGTVLDVGCGNGVTLRAFGKTHPGWRLEGHEISDQSLPQLSAVPGFAALHSGSLANIRGCYELITMVHTLEHFVDPLATLAGIRGLLSDEGLLFVEVCNIEENPFDVLVADHLMHFSPSTLSALLLRAGLEPVAVATDWVGKEISAVARPRARPVAPSHDRAEPLWGWARLPATMEWLRKFVESARQAAQDSRTFGLFGTSISGTWLASQLGDRVDCFVDEDAGRIGKQHLGKPVLEPSGIGAGTTVYVALTPAVADAVIARLRQYAGTWVLPPAP